MKKRIFVFGSNLAGRHGAGAARYAHVKEGAAYGVGYGFTGNSFAIPTKDARIQTMSLEDIESYVELFIQAAKYNSDKEFTVTRIGCGLAGHRDSDIAPMFEKASSNCFFDDAWKPFLGPSRGYWGTF